MRARLSLVGLLLAMSSPALADEAHLLRRPELLGNPSASFHWTPEALAHRASGVATLQCRLSALGHPRACRVLSGVAHVPNADVVSYAQGLVFTPAVSRDGAAIPLDDFRFPIRLVAPRAHLPWVPLPRPF
jgi:hypothetical protein